MSTWECGAIDHGITIFPNGKIGPCCQIHSDYLKPISVINDPNRFSDLKTPIESPPAACILCTNNEARGVESYRTQYQPSDNLPGIKYVDIRNTNLCNIKCRTCGPHFSNKWAEELGHSITIKNQSVDEHLELLLTDSLEKIYFTGGEPMISKDHWHILEELIRTGRSKKINLMYNTNMTVLKFKDKDIIDMWNQFAHVAINCSLDAIGKPLEYIRSGTSWNDVSQNLNKLIKLDKNKFTIIISPTIGILNIWFLKELTEFAYNNNLRFSPILMDGPPFLEISVIPDSLKELALEQLRLADSYGVMPNGVTDVLKNKITNNQNSHLFDHAVRHVLLLDSIRNEKLFDLLPFKQHVLRNTIHWFVEYDT